MGLPDVGAYEIQANDADADGLTDAEEGGLGSLVNNPDSDGDGLNDYDEVHVYNTGIMNPNTDGDPLNDGEEPAVGMNPAVADGTTLLDIFDIGFEDTDDYPEGAWSQSKWAAVNSAYSGNLQIKTVDPDQTIEGGGIRVAICYGQTPESRCISLVQRNGLEDYWISWVFKMPRAKLPTNKDEAINIAGAYLAIDENGFLNCYDGNLEAWIPDEVGEIPEDVWVNFIVHRNHSGKIVDVWVNGRGVFNNFPISGPDPANYIRFSFSCVEEYDVWLDQLIGYRYNPF